VNPQSTPEDSPSPAPKASPSPKSQGPRPSPTDRTGVVWEEPPALIPAAADPAKPEPSAAPLPKRKSVAKREGKVSTRVALVSQNGNTEKRKAVPSPLPAATLDAAEARNELQSRWQAKQEEVRLEKEQNRKRNQEFNGREPGAMEVPSGGMAGEDEN
jgi:hypothetical protein